MSDFFIYLIVTLTIEAKCKIRKLTDCSLSTSVIQQKLNLSCKVVQKMKEKNEYSSILPFSKEYYYHM